MTKIFILKSDKNHLKKLLFAKKVSDKPIIPFGVVRLGNRATHVVYVIWNVLRSEGLILSWER